jgi:alpha-L-rhamnosidase
MLKVTDPRCEYKSNPIGIEEPVPRFSWIVESAEENKYAERQTAYRIIVSRSNENIFNCSGDVWDTGKIISAKTCQIDYGGESLLPVTEYFWRIMVWDENDVASDWSIPARWVTGLFTPGEWQARLIGLDTWLENYRKNVKFAFTAGKDKWIWHPDINDIKCDVYFRKSFTIDRRTNHQKIHILISADEWWVLYINGREVDRSDRYIFSWARPKLIEISGNIEQGVNQIAIQTSNSYLDKPGLSAVVFGADPEDVKIICRTDKNWKCTKHFIADWFSTDADDSDWENASVYARMGDLPWRIPHHELILPPPVYLRKDFRIAKKVKHAFLFGTALGIIHFRLNGIKVSSDLFTPGWTDYGKRLHYRAYDVTELMIDENKNTLGCILADGWYSGYVAWERRRGLYGEYPRALIRLHIEYRDGSTDSIVSDESWKASYGPHREADILMGEIYDAREEEKLLGWDTPEFSDTAWDSVIAEPVAPRNICSHPGPPVKEMIELPTRAIFIPAPGVYIFDICQNIAGYARLKITGTRGTEIRLRYGEMLRPDGSLYTTNLRNARATDVYILKGGREETWSPLFTYHGFRYVELTGCETAPAPETITGVAIHADMKKSGSFRCSDPVINKIYENICWSIKSNFMDIPTDCPQRDERLGWLDSNVFPVAAYSFDVTAFYTKWLADINDAQSENGAYPPIAPLPDLATGPLYEGAPAWADSGILIPYLLYRYYGDVRATERYYGHMQKYIDYLVVHSDGLIRPDYGYGDWLSVDTETPRSLIGTAYFAHVSNVMATLARIIGRYDDSRKYHVLSNSVRKAFNDKFVGDNGRILGDSQTAYILALQFGLLESPVKEKAVARLMSDIEQRGGQLTTGFIGISHLLTVLSDNGRGDLAFNLVSRISFPSWGYMIQCGATTIWERWNSWTQETGFYDPLMNSFNHFSLGAFGHWLFESLAGIRINIPSESHRFTIRPELPFALSETIGLYGSIDGNIYTRVRNDQGDKTFEIKIPVNSSARVILPGEMRLMTELDPKQYSMRLEDETVIYELYSGNYVFKGKIE